jgi:hypothetical protein
LERKLQEIMTRLTAGNTEQQPASSSKLLGQSSIDFVKVAGHQRMQSMFTGSTAIPSLRFSKAVVDGLQDVISKGYVSLEQASVLLQRYRLEAYNFPFVILHPTTGIDLLRRNRPFLLLSILTFAAQDHLDLQRKLEEELKATFATKAIMNGEKSLDLLQGLLVYLNW